MEYSKYLNQDEMVKGLVRVLKVNSEEAPLLKNDDTVYPFGMGVQKALEETLSLASEMGFTTYNCDNYGGHIDFPGESDKVVGIIGHLDVVPAGSNWDHDPYGGEVSDGYIYGRGTTDDKGPVISCLYAMKALKDGGFKPKNTIRIILGLDEETNWDGINYYFEHVKKPDYGFTPDADFPVIYAEKGLIIFDIFKKFQKYNNKGLELRTIKGGTAPNAVPDSCRAVLYDTKDSDTKYEEIKDLIERFKDETNYKINYKVVGKSIEIVTTGVSAHGAMPWKGVNAISIMIKLLSRLQFVNDDRNDFINFYETHIGFDLNGERIGMKLSDEVSKDLVFNVGMIDLNSESSKLTINVRYPVTCTEDMVYKELPSILEKYNMGYVKESHKKPIFMDLDNPIVKTLYKTYVDHTGDTMTKPLVIGGGTYARSCENIVAFGALFPGDPDIMHQRNEKLSIKRYMDMTEIYLDAIYKLSSEQFDK